MDKKTITLANNLGIFAISNFASKILVFLLVPLYTNILSTDEYGIYDLVVTTISLLIPIISLNIIDALMRFLMDQQIDKSQVASIGIYYTFLSIIIFSSLTYFFCLFSVGQKINGYELLIILYYIFYALNLYCVHFAKGIEKIKETAFAGVIGSVSMISMNIFFLCYLKYGLKGFFLANIISHALPSVFLMLSLKIWKYIKVKKLNHELECKMLGYSVPLVVTAVGWWVNNGSDKYIVTMVCGVSACGLLSVAYKIPSIINTFQSIFIQAWQISAIKEFGKKETCIFYGRTFSFINFMMCLSCSILIIFTKPLSRILFAKEFYLAWELIPFLLVSCVFNSASGVLGPILSAKKNSKILAFSAFWGAVINILLNIVLVNFIGIQGTTIATAFSSFIIFGLRYINLKCDLILEKKFTIIFTWILLIFQTLVEIFTNMWIIEVAIIITIIMINRFYFSAIINFMAKLLKHTKITF